MLAQSNSNKGWIGMLVVMALSGMVTSARDVSLATPATVAAATGGTITTNGNYRIHTFANHTCPK